MDAKQYLRQLRRLDEMVNAKLYQVHELRSLAEKMTGAPNIEGVHVPAQQDRLGSIIAKIVDLEISINRDVDKLIDSKTHAIALIDSLGNDDHRLLLTLRYINFKTWEQIAVDMGYTYKWVHILHSRALVNFGERYQESKKSA